MILFFEFARLKKVQLERVEFPLLSIVRGDTAWLTEKQWKYESLFMNQDYYTVFYNDEEQMELEKRTDLNRVDVEQTIWKTVGQDVSFPTAERGMAVDAGEHT